MTPRELFYFAGRCLTLDTLPEARPPVAAAFSAGKVPQARLIHLCDRHLVLPALYRSLRAYNLIRFLEPELAARLAEIHAWNKARNEAILAQTEAIAEVLGAQGIAPVYLKGVAHLLEGLYRDPGDRILGDIDLLVEKAHYVAAAQCLMHNGYTVAEACHDDVLLMKHYPRLRHEGAPAVVEVHQALFAPEVCQSLPGSAVCARKKPVTGRPNCFVPCTEDQIAHNVIHSRLAHSGERFRVTSLRDIHDLRLLAQRVDLPKILPRLHGKDTVEGYFLFAAQALGLGPSLYHTTNPHALRSCARNDRALRHPRLARRRIQLLKVGDVIFKRYLGRLFRALFRRADRQHILRRVKDPAWYSMHFARLKQYFRS